MVFRNVQKTNPSKNSRANGLYKCSKGRRKEKFIPFLSTSAVPLFVCLSSAIPSFEGTQIAIHMRLFFSYTVLQHLHDHDIDIQII